MRLLIFILLLHCAAADKEISQPMLFICNIALTFGLVGVYGYKLARMYSKEDATP